MSLLSNIFGPRQAFDGGLFLPDHKAPYARQPIETLTADGPLNVPLTVRAEYPARAVVRVGDHVKRGSRLSEPLDNRGLPVHSPVAGRVTSLSTAWTPVDGALPSVVVEPDGSAEAVAQRQGWENESLIVQLAECGVFCGTPRVPLHAHLQTAIARGATDLIVNAMETEPYLAGDLRTIVESPGRIVDATCELADALGVSRAIMAVPFRHRFAVKRLKSEVVGRLVELVAMADPYPQCHPVVLVKALLGREVPPGGTPLDENAVVLPLSAVRAAADALLDDKPVTHVAVTIAGDAVERPGVYRVPIGTPIGRLAKRVGLLTSPVQAIYGGPLTGSAIRHPDTVITADATGVLLFSTRNEVQPAACVRCGWCVEDCPIGLSPNEFIGFDARPSHSAVELSQLKACIDCGLCTHVCPSQLPLAQTIRRVRDRNSAAADTAGSRA